MNLSDIQLLVRMNHAVRHAGQMGPAALDFNAVYRADFATNQPNWLEEMKVFVHGNGPAMLLCVTDGSFKVEGFALHSDIQEENRIAAQEERNLLAAMERSVMRQNRSEHE